MTENFGAKTNIGTSLINMECIGINMARIIEAYKLSAKNFKKSSWGSSEHTTFNSTEFQNEGDFFWSRNGSNSKSRFLNSK